MKYLIMIFSFMTYGATIQNGIYKGSDDLGRSCQVEIKKCVSDSVNCVGLYGVEYSLSYSFVGIEAKALDTYKAIFNNKMIDHNFNVELGSEGSVDSFRTIVTENGYLVPYPKSYFLNCYNLSL